MAESQHNEKEFFQAVDKTTQKHLPYQRDGKMVDFDPANDYQDGYNAGRRYSAYDEGWKASRHAGSHLRKREHILLAFAAGQIATIIAYFVGRA